jgi:hypothetical protein
MNAGSQATAYRLILSPIFMQDMQHPSALSSNTTASMHTHMQKVTKHREDKYSVISMTYSSSCSS